MSSAKPRDALSPSARSLFFTQSLPVVTLLNLALAARLYELLGRQPAFFVVRRAEAIDLIALAAIFSLLLPAAVAICVWAIGLAWRPLGQAAFALVVAAAMTAIVLPLVVRSRGSPSALLWTGMAGGLLAAGAYFRFAAVRRLVAFLWPATLVLPGLFLFASPAARVLQWTSAPPLLDVKETRPAPVVFIILDECCGLTLLDDRGRIDRGRFPNFAALADGATWFRNATTMSTSTHHAVPCILSGDHPHGPLAAPVGVEYPHNLFTLLGKNHAVTAREAETYLCPPQLDGFGRGSAAFFPRMRSLLLDAAALEMRVLLPADGPVPLPDMTGRWGNFWNQDADSPDRPSPHVHRREQFDEFLGHIQASAKPGFYYAHLMLPHVPWTFMPSGKEYPQPLDEAMLQNVNVTHGVLGLHRESEHWTAEELPVAQALARYLLQLRLVDRLMGRLVARLKQAGLYDASLIVVMADHGVSIRPDDDRRNLTETNYADILSIPLLVKRPGQRRGETSDRNVQSVDVLPTVADVLGIELPWKADGISAFDASRPEPARKEISREEEWKDRATFDAKSWGQAEARRRLLAVSRDDATLHGLFRLGPKPEWIGRSLERLTLGPPSPCRAKLNSPDLYDDVRPDGPELPCFLVGRIAPEGDQGLPLELAIAVNGTVWATTRTMRAPGLENVWQAVVPEEALRAGKNRIEVFLIDGSGDEAMLRRAADAAREGPGR